MPPADALALADRWAHMLDDGWNHHLHVSGAETAQLATALISLADAYRKAVG